MATNQDYLIVYYNKEGGVIGHEIASFQNVSTLRAWLEAEIANQYPDTHSLIARKLAEATHTATMQPTTAVVPNG